MLCCVTLYSGCLCCNSQWNGPYFLVFSIGFSSPFCTHGQLISSSLTSFLSLSIILAPILLALTWVVSANNGTSTYASTRSFSYIAFGWGWEPRGAVAVMRCKDLSISKKKTRFWKLYCALPDTVFERLRCSLLVYDQRFQMFYHTYGNVRQHFRSCQSSCGGKPW